MMAYITKNCWTDLVQGFTMIRTTPRQRVRIPHEPPRAGFEDRIPPRSQIPEEAGHPPGQLLPVFRRGAGLGTTVRPCPPPPTTPTRVRRSSTSTALCCRVP